MFEVVIFVLLVFLSAFFSASETAYFSLSPARVRLMIQNKRPMASMVAKLRGNPHKLLITILIGNNIVNLFTASYATVVAAEFFGSAALGVATGATTLAILVFGEIIPKSFAYARNTAVASLAAGPLYVLGIVFTPAVFLLDSLNGLLRRLLGSDKENEAAVSEEEVRALSRLGVESGAINYREHRMIEKIFSFDDTPVDKVMTPWYKVVTLSGTVPVEQIAHFVAHEGFTRYPVNDGRNDDNIIGYIHVNQIMKALNSDRRDAPLAEFVSPVKTVCSDMSVERVFRSMLARREHLFLVRDKDSGNLVGMVTLEDIIEEILGEIEDETDALVQIEK